MLRAASSVATLFVFWLLLSGIYTPFRARRWLASIAVAWLALAWTWSTARAIRSIWARRDGRYWPWLAKEIVSRRGM